MTGDPETYFFMSCENCHSTIRLSVPIFQHEMKISPGIPCPVCHEFNTLYMTGGGSGYANDTFGRGLDP